METIEVGYWIAATLKKDTAPLRCFVGQIVAVDAFGLKIHLDMDGLEREKINRGIFYTCDVFVPWPNLESALLAEPDCDLSHFNQDANKWQEAMLKGLNYVELES